MGAGARGSRQSDKGFGGGGSDGGRDGRKGDEVNAKVRPLLPRGSKTLGQLANGVGIDDCDCVSLSIGLRVLSRRSSSAWTE